MRSTTLALALPALVALGVGLSACATITRDECRAEDWASIGQRDGAEGHAPSRLESHARTCANFSIVPDPEAYRAGWDTGVLLYCTPQNGFATARESKPYHGLCPASVAGRFLEGREVGSRLGAAERRVAAAESTLRNGESERERLRRRMDEVREDGGLSADEKTRPARRDARQDRRPALGNGRGALRAAAGARGAAARRGGGAALLRGAGGSRLAHRGTLSFHSRCVRADSLRILESPPPCPSSPGSSSASSPAS